MLLRQRAEQIVHLPARFRLQRSLLWSLLGGYDVRNIGHRVRSVTRGIAVGVRHLVRGDAIDEGHERPALVLIPRQCRHNGKAYLLRHIVGGELAALRRSDPRPAISHDERSDNLQYLG